MRKNQLIMITGGGTGGHVYPALSIAELLKSEVEIEWIGSKRGIEKSIVARKGIIYNAIYSGKFRRYFSFRNFFDLFLIFIGFIQSISILMRKKPLVLFSKGGFVSVPPVLAARLLKIPVVSHESDVDPGLATKINAASSAKICIPYKESIKYYPEKWHSRLSVTGNPVRPEFSVSDRNRGRKLLGITSDMPVLLVVGGSLGSLQINNALAKILHEITKNIFVIHQTGKNWKPDESMLAERNYLPLEFINDNYPDLLAASDLVVTRGGAGSLWEIASQKKKTIIIPLGLSASRGDQIRNAGLFKEWGLAAVLDEEALTPKLLKDELEKLQFDNYDTIINNYNKHFNFEADREICRIIKEEAGI